MRRDGKVPYQQGLWLATLYFMKHVQQLLRRAAFLRRPIGIICLVIGILGWIFPILPGWPFIIPAIALLGRRDRTLRRMHLMLRHVLRSMRRARQQWLRKLGVRSSVEYVRVKKLVTPMIIRAERALGAE